MIYSLLEGQIVKPEITEQVSFVVLAAGPEELDPDSIGYQVIELVAGEASKIARYKIYNRQDLQRRWEELALYQSGFISDEEMIEFGKIVNVKEVMTVRVTDLIEREVIVSEEERLGLMNPEVDYTNITDEQIQESLNQIAKHVGRKDPLEEKSIEELRLIYNLNKMSNRSDYDHFTETEKQKF